jgi:hypothetical protein
MLKKIFYIILIFLSVCSFSYADDTKIRNLYILIEPTANPNEKAADNILVPSLVNLNDVLNKIIEFNTFSKVLIRIAGKNNQVLEFKRNEIKNISEQNLIVQIYNLIKNKKDYNISNSLSFYSQDLQKKKLKGKNTLFLIIGDINYVSNGISSHNGYLNSAWLTNTNSPFVKDFIQLDNDIAKDSSVVVFTRTQLDLKQEKKRKDFIVNLFSKVDMNVFYVGDMYKNFGIPIDEKYFFSFQLIKEVKKRNLDIIKPTNMLDVQACQIISKTAITIPNCGEK